jgi:BMFP domain-containing protein YqiC
MTPHVLVFSRIRPISDVKPHKCVRAGPMAREDAPNLLATHRHGALAGLTRTPLMNNFFNDLQGKINQAIDSSPAKDIERNVKAMMTQGLSKLDLVTREEFDIQAQVLAKTRAKLDALELRVNELEARLTGSAAAAAAPLPSAGATASTASMGSTDAAPKF